MAREALTRHWTDDELAELRRLLLEGRSAARIGVRLKRSPASVDRMCLKLGLPTPAQLKRRADGKLL